MDTKRKSSPVKNQQQLEQLMADINRSGVKTAFYGEPDWPVIVTATDSRLCTDPAASAAWLKDHKHLVDQLVLHGGAVMLRGFAIPGVEDFDRFMAPYPTADFDYSGGATNRGAAQGRVFEATSAPADFRLRLHQEMAYLPHYPDALCFYCHQAPAQGGETIIGDMRNFTDRVNPDFLARVKARGVLYVRNFRDPEASTGNEVLDSVHRTWREAFYTDDKAHVESECARMGLGCQWLANGSVSVTYKATGFISHPQTGEEIWFNQIATQTVTMENFGPARYPLMKAFYSDDYPPPFDTRYGDGSKIALDDVNSLYPVYDDIVVAIPYRQGDVLLLDNFQTAHGRNAYEGTRDVKVMLLSAS